MYDNTPQPLDERPNATRGSVLVIGATGTQGMGAARHLIERGWSVTGLVRDASTAPARHLAECGVKLHCGDMADGASLRVAMRDVEAVFSMQPGRGPDPAYTPVTETSWGMAVADAASACGVAHLVQMSVAGAERNTGVGFWESKRRIEVYIDKLGLPATILRPAAFMENLASPSVSLTPDGLLLMSNADTRWQLIAGDDIGMIAAEVFGNRKEFLGRAIEIAGDEKSAAEIAETMSVAIRRPFPLLPPPRDLMRRSPDLQKAYDFATREDAWRADVGALRRRFPRLKRLEEWLAQGGAVRVRSALAGL